jgi:hypothetical protein
MWTVRSVTCVSMLAATYPLGPLFPLFPLFLLFRGRRRRQPCRIQLSGGSDPLGADSAAG